MLETVSPSGGRRPGRMRVDHGFQSYWVAVCTSRRRQVGDRAAQQCVAVLGVDDRFVITAKQVSAGDAVDIDKHKQLGAVV